MSEPLERLLHKTRELAELTEAFTRHAIERNFEAMALDVSAITAATTELERIAAAAQAGDSAAIQAAVAAAEESDQAALNTAVAPLTSAVASLTAEFPPKAASSLTVSPDPISISVGSTSPVALTFTGATGTISASGLPSGVTFDGSAIVSSSTAQIFRCW